MQFFFYMILLFCQHILLNITHAPISEIYFTYLYV